MRPVQKLSIAEQTAGHVREGIRSGRWRGELPGVLLLAKACDVSKGAMRDALKILEAEGLISAGHAGAHRTVLTTIAVTPRSVLRVAILRHSPPALESENLREILHAVQRDLLAAGHTVVFAAKTQTDLNFDTARIAKLIAATPADAWIVEAAPREVLDVFMAQPVPAIALAGRCIGAPMASAYTDSTPGFVEATRQLITLGHRRIVLVCPRFWRLPTHGGLVRAFTAALAEGGITASDYNTPDHEPDGPGLQALFKSLFSATPPTALIFEVAETAVPAFTFLALRGLAVPRDVSLVCAFTDGAVQWCDPPLAHLNTNTDHVARRIERWVRAVSRGRADRDAVGVPVTFVPGGTIGPVRK